MQSPLNLNPADPQSPFHPLAQMYLISPPGQAQGQNQQNAAHAWQEGEAGDGGQYQRKWNDPHAMAGVLTPGQSVASFSFTRVDPYIAQSGDIFPQIRPEMMSPMQLEILARGEAVERPRDVNIMSHFGNVNTYGHSSSPLLPYCRRLYRIKLVVPLIPPQQPMPPMAHIPIILKINQ